MLNDKALIFGGIDYRMIDSDTGQETITTIVYFEYESDKLHVVCPLAEHFTQLELNCLNKISRRMLQLDDIIE